MTKQKKIIVFGSNGFIGKRLCSHLRTIKYLSVISPTSTECNLLDEKLVSATLQNCDENTTVVMCAAIGRATEDSISSMNKNCKMIKNIVSHNYTNGIKGIVFLSSVDVYGRPPECLPIDEKSYPLLDTYYGMSKYISEKMLEKEMGKLCPVTILRLPGVYGYQDDFKSIIGRFIKQALDKREITIFGDGNQRRDYIDVSDVCNVIESFIYNPQHVTVNLVSGNSYTLTELSNIICSRVKGVSIKYKSENREDNFNLTFDNQKIKILTQFSPFKQPDVGIADYLKEIESL